MFKNIKKLIKYLIIFLGVIVMVPVVLYSVLQISEVQTFIVQRVINHLSYQIKSTISVGQIEYKFFNKLIINDILIQDKNNDTLFFAPLLTTGINRVNIRKNSLRLGKVELIRPVVNLITDSSGTMNLTWYLNMFKNSSDTTKNRKSIISIDQIDLSDARLSLVNYSASKGKTRIDFNNLKITGLNGIIENVKIENDTTNLSIYNLTFKEAGGFSIRRMNCSVMAAKQSILFNSIYLLCDSSIINISKFGLTPDSISRFENFTEKVRLDVAIEKSLINSSDLKYFLPFAEKMDESIWLSGKIAGTVSELRGRNIELKYRDFTYLDCDFDFSGLPNIDNTFIYIGVNSLKTNAEDLAKLYFNGKKALTIPDILNKLGNISFDGSFTGFSTDFVTYGKFRTEQGIIRTDISLRPEESKKYKIKGLITGSDINVGEISGNTKMLGKFSMQANVDGYANSLNKFAVNLSGKIDSLEINRYKYRNIALNGFFTEKTWDGSININDKNIKLSVLGMFNFNDKLPVFDFTLNLSRADLYRLNFEKLDTSSSLSLLLTSNFRGNNIDNLDGEIKLLNSKITKYNKNLELSDFSVRTYKENNTPVLSLRTDFIDADIRGYYSFAALGSLIKSTLYNLMPSKFNPATQPKKQKKNNFTFDVNFKNTDKINSFFRTGVFISDKSFITGIISSDSLLIIKGSSKLLTIMSNAISDFSLNANIKKSELSVDLKSSSLSLLKQSQLKDFYISLRTKPDNFIFNLNWDNKEKVLNNGNFIARGRFEKLAADTTKSILIINIDSTDIFARNNHWKIKQSSIVLDSTSVDINKFYVENNENFYMIDGSVSQDPLDTLKLEFKGIDISPINYLGRQSQSKDPNIIPMDLKGSLNGKILLTDVYKNLILESNIIVNNFSLLGSEFGNISLVSRLDNDNKLININAGNKLGGVKTLDVSGIYDPVLKKINLTFIPSKLSINALNPLLKVFASGINGSTSGKVNLSGEPGNLVLKGALMAENASLKIDYLQTKYKLNDTIRFDKNGIKFNNVTFTDEKGNKGTLSGTVNHKSFKDFRADVIVNTKESFVLNTKPKDNQLFYGTAFASGVTTIKSGPNSLAFDISASTGKNTNFFIPLNYGQSVSEYSFVTFIDKNAKKEGETEGDKTKSIAPPKQTGIDLNFDLQVNPEAEVQLIFDSKVGDVMKGHGSGNLNITYNTKGEFKMSGDYIIEEGDYLFTLGNIFNKSFSVDNGGKIIFNGDLDNAEIDIKAIYKLRTSLYEILKDERFKERIPVECQLNLTGKLFNPIVKLNIYLPSSDEQTRTYLQNAISTEEELSRQFLYLLVMNSFYSDQVSYGSASTSTTGTSAMAVTTTEMISNQLSNWISQISNDFDLGFVYRPGTSSINPQEVEVALSTQLLNDKVVINGNFDLRGTGNAATSTDQITGDFDAEVKITEKLRFKVFNRFNDIYSGKGPYTQGIGIFFKEDFDKFSDLFKKKVKSDMKKEEETKITNE
jgi:hypothetical protein